MEPLQIRGDNVYPTVNFNPDSGILKISGKSVPEDSEMFYRKALNWLDKYAKSPKKKTHFIFDLEYFNITSSKRLLFILYKLDEIAKKGSEVLVTWYYNRKDDDMEEVGHDLEHMVDLPFEIKPHQSLENNRKVHAVT